MNGNDKIYRIYRFTFWVTTEREKRDTGSVPRVNQPVTGGGTTSRRPHRWWNTSAVSVLV